MEAVIIKDTKESVTIQVTIPKDGSIMQIEEMIQKGLNKAGVIATQKALEKFDTDGAPIIVGVKKFTSKGKQEKEYQTPYGATIISRHVYQSNEGGETYCPMEIDSRIVITSTPFFARIIAFKYAEFGAGRVMEDLEQNHGRKVVKSFIQNIAEVIASIAQLKEENWSYDLPKDLPKISFMSFGIDGTCMLMCEDGWREAMVGTIAFYDKEGDRKHTIYTATTPEYGKEKFLKKMEEEFKRAKNQYPKAFVVGIADGSKANWPFLKEHTDVQVLDFFHASGYLGKAAEAGIKSEKDREEWLDDVCHKLKHNKTGTSNAIKKMEELLEKKLSQEKIEKIESSIIYFQNNKHMMIYAEQVDQNLPIGSGVTEAACKVIVKQRLCGSGMRWKEAGAGSVLSLRTLSYTKERWEQFWNKIDRYGFGMAA